MCGKINYTTYKDAEKAMRIIKSRVEKYSETVPAPKRVYKCDVCGKFHLTSMKRRK